MMKLSNFIYLLLFLIYTNASAQSSYVVHEKSILELQQALQQGDTTSVEIVTQFLKRIEAYDRNGPKINSVIRINPNAISLAAALDSERSTSGARSALHGIPILVKDNYNTLDLPTTGGSVALAEFFATEEATQIAKLRDAGAIILAKTNLHEFAYGITTISSILGQTRNPYDIRRVPGGSSGGTGAGVAASFAVFGLGSDTCGSVRIPSAFNNLFGLRPSKGLSSIYGVMPLSHTQDVAAPLARSLSDLAISLDIVSGYDPKDSATEIMRGAEATEFYDRLGSIDLKGLRFGRLSDYFSSADDESIRLIEEALAWFENEGVEIVDIQIPLMRELIAASGVIGHEFETDLNLYLNKFSDGNSLTLDDIVANGEFHSGVENALTRSSKSDLDEERYQEALKKREELRTAIEAVIDEFDLDALVYPPISQTAVLIGEQQPGNNCSLSANSGLPALTVPVGFTVQGLPVGMELLGGYRDDETLLAFAFPYEQAQRPRIAPSVTPPLINDEAPIPRNYSLFLDEQGLQLNADVNWSQSKNLLSITLTVPDSSLVTPSAAILAINTDDQSLFNEPAVESLLSPDQSVSETELFLSPQLIQALNENRAYIRIYSNRFTTGNVVLPIQ